MGHAADLQADRDEERGAGLMNLYQVFNMGIGMVSVVAAEDKAEAALKFIKAKKHKAGIIGEVVKGRGEARVAVSFLERKRIKRDTALRHRLQRGTTRIYSKAPSPLHFAGAVRNRSPVR